MFTISLPPPLEAQFRELVAMTGKTMEACLSEAVTRMLEEAEARQDYLTGVEALARQESSISLNELEKRLGLAG